MGSLFGRRGVGADLVEVAGRYRVHRRAGQAGAEEVRLNGPGGERLHFLLGAAQSARRPPRCRRDAFGNPHHGGSLPPSSVPD